VGKDRWHLSAEPTEKLDQESQDRLAHLKSWLAKYMRRVKLPDPPDRSRQSAWLYSQFPHARPARIAIPPGDPRRPASSHGARLQSGRLHDGAADLGGHLRAAQADRRLAIDRGGPAKRPGGIGERD